MIFVNIFVFLIAGYMKKLFVKLLDDFEFINFNMMNVKNL